jgi:hypothetical protein
MSVYISASYGSQITIWGIFSSGELILAAAGLSFAAIGEVLFNSNAYIRTRLAVWLVLELPPIGRSWPTTRSVLPAIVGPGLSYEPAHDDDHLRGGNPKIDDPISAFGTPHELLVGVLFQEFVRSTTQRFVAASGAGLPFSEIAGNKPRSFSFSLVARES